MSHFVNFWIVQEQIIIASPPFVVNIEFFAFMGKQ